MENHVLRAVDIHKYFAGVRALDGVSLEIKAGEIHCLAGENGCGKSTLIKVISGVYQKDRGRLEYGGTVLDKVEPIDAIKKGIQVIYQDFSIFPNLSVMENLAINSELVENRKIVNWKHVREIAEEAVKKIGFHVDLEVPLGTLTVADKQMVAICRALMFDAKLIIMDEPTTALTKKEVKALFKVIKELQEQGIAILFVSHKLDEVFEISERFTIVRSGKVVATGNTKELDDAKFSYYMTGREFSAKTFTPKNVTETPLLEVKDISLYGRFEKISFSVKGGEILGITGLLNSGRSELALSLFGIKPIDEGRIYVNGTEVKINTPQDAMKNNIGLVPEDRLSEGLFLSQSIGDNIIIAEFDRFTRAQMIDWEKYRKEVDHWIKELAIATPNADNAVSTLSGGNQQRVVLAKWLACKPRILILNGPTVGVDIGSKHDMHAILQKLAGDGMAVIIISDDLPEIMQNCSQIIVLKNGVISGRLKTDDIVENQIIDCMM